MRTEELIVQLASEGRPVHVLRPPAIRFATWAALASVVTVACVLIKGARADAAVEITQPPFLLTLAVTFGTALAAGRAALSFAVPGAADGRLWRAAAFGFAGLWIAALLWPVLSTGAVIDHFAREPRYLVCVAKVILVGVVPVAIALEMVRRAAPLQPGWAIGLASLGGLGFGAVGAQWICPIDRAPHLLLWHVAPVLALSALAAAATTFGNAAQQPSLQA